MKSWKRRKKVDRSKIVCKEYNKTCDYKKFKTIRVFGDEIRNNIINMHMENDKQNKFAKYIEELKQNHKIILI